MLSVKVTNNRIHIGERFSVSFQRTLRIPDDGQNYPLPPGLGAFPLSRVQDYADHLPTSWQEQNAVFIPMYQREALWLGFDGTDWKPNAVKVGVGKINAISGEGWNEQLHSDPQDYLVCPNQPWLDGINAGQGFIRQFVATPLGLGYTVEAQVSGAEEFGGIQLLVYEPKPGRFPDQPPPKREQKSGVFFTPSPRLLEEMGLGVGGRMKQKIYPDPYGIDTWDRQNYGSVFIHIVNSRQYQELTGLVPPPTPISAQTYTKYKLPWFDLYDEAVGDVAASERLAEVKSIKEKEVEKGITPQEEVVHVDTSTVKKLHHEGLSKDD